MMPWTPLKTFAGETELEARIAKLRKLEHRLIDSLPTEGPIDWPSYRRRTRRICELQAIHQWLLCWRDTCRADPVYAWRPLV